MPSIGGILQFAQARVARCDVGWHEHELST